MNRNVHDVLKTFCDYEAWCYSTLLYRSLKAQFVWKLTFESQPWSVYNLLIWEWDSKSNFLTYIFWYLRWYLDKPAWTYVSTCNLSLHLWWISSCRSLMCIAGSNRYVCTHKKGRTWCLAVAKFTRKHKWLRICHRRCFVKFMKLLLSHNYQNWSIFLWSLVDFWMGYICRTHPGAVSPSWLCCCCLNSRTIQPNSTFILHKIYWRHHIDRPLSTHCCDGLPVLTHVAHSCFLFCPQTADI